VITITELAARKVEETRQARARDVAGIRLVVRNAGTPRVEYALHFVEPGGALPSDLVFDHGPVRVLVDSASAPFLENATLDYVETSEGSGFKVDAPRAVPPRIDGPLAEQVQRVIEEKINPAVASHGGWVSLVAVEGDSVFVRLGGGCQGCGMVSVTLKRGIETMIREAVPAIQRVLDVTDHAGGTNPYYQPGA